MADFPVDLTYMPNVEKRVKLAIKADGLINKQKKSHSRNSWVKKAAQELDIDLDEDDLIQFELEEDDDTKRQRKQAQAEIDRVKAQLNELLRHPLLPLGTSHRYIPSSAMLKTLEKPDSAGKALEVLNSAPKQKNMLLKKKPNKFVKK